MKPTDIPPRYTNHYSCVKEAIEQEQQVSMEVLQEDALESPNGAVIAGARVSPEPSTDNTSSNNNKPRQLNFQAQQIRSQNQEIEVGVPTSHTVIHKTELAKLRAIEKKYKAMKTQVERIKVDPSPIAKAVYATAAASTPALALSAMEHVIPLVCYAALVDTGLLENIDIDRFCRSFPKYTFMRDTAIPDRAAELLLHLSSMLQNKRVYLSCDKGNKKGVGHFVKVLSYYDETNCCTMKHVLDIDASGGSTEDCALAIKASMAKLKGVLLSGATTDSGGGGVLDDLASKLQQTRIGVTVGSDDYKVANCTIHAIQLTLANPIKATIGEGKLESRNLLQLMHSGVYDMQEAVGIEESQFVLELSDEFVTKKLSTDDDGVAVETAEDDTDGDKAFQLLWNKVSRFRLFNTLSQDEGKYLRQKLPAPVLTRWHTIGVAADVIDTLYLQLLKATQVYINTNSANSRVGKVASGLQSLLAEASFFSDLQLVKCFHIAFLQDHLEWLQSSTDMSNEAGFQSHQVLLRFFLMDKDLNYLARSVHSTHPKFQAYRDSLLNLTESERDNQTKKTDLFLLESRKALNKHFQRWGSIQLLPAALLSEAPFAAAVARTMLHINHEEVTTNSIVRSAAHGNRPVDVGPFESFVVAIAEHVTDDGNCYHENELTAARMLLDRNIDLRQQELSKDAADVVIVKRFLFDSYLPLAHATQFVEAGVKLAKLVASTGRAEESRSSYAIVKSATDSIGKIREMKRGDKAAKWIKQAEDHVVALNQLRAADSVAYDTSLQNIKQALKPKGHFKKTRVATSNAKLKRKAETNKKQNKLQKMVGVDVTYGVLGLVPYGKLKKDLHLKHVRTELSFRGLLFEKNDGIRSLCAMLKKHEIERVVGEAKGHADKAFTVLSSAVFDVDYEGN